MIYKQNLKKYKQNEIKIKNQYEKKLIQFVILKIIFVNNGCSKNQTTEEDVSENEQQVIIADEEEGKTKTLKRKKRNKKNKSHNKNNKNNNKDEDEDEDENNNEDENENNNEGKSIKKKTPTTTPTTTTTTTNQDTKYDEDYEKTILEDEKKKFLHKLEQSFNHFKQDEHTSEISKYKKEIILAVFGGDKEHYDNKTKHRTIKAVENILLPAKYNREETKYFRFFTRSTLNYGNSRYKDYSEYITTALKDKKHICTKEVYQKTIKDFNDINKIKPQRLINAEQDKKDILVYTLIKLSILCYKLINNQIIVSDLNKKN